MHPPNFSLSPMLTFDVFDVEIQPSYLYNGLEIQPSYGFEVQQSYGFEIQPSYTLRNVLGGHASSSQSSQSSYSPHHPWIGDHDSPSTASSSNTPPPMSYDTYQHGANPTHAAPVDIDTAAHSSWAQEQPMTQLTGSSGKAATQKARKAVSKAKEKPMTQAGRKGKRGPRAARGHRDGGSTVSDPFYQDPSQEWDIVLLRPVESLPRFRWRERGSTPPRPLPPDYAVHSSCEGLSMHLTVLEESGPQMVSRLSSSFIFLCSLVIFYFFPFFCLCLRA
ncbi:hypothetical protein CVT24_008581 [Panaeolus cyanescens]|uniref:Uncharacterized protein n=1 Tax=Panaeolus cyanescens TaxID=181874 RepID=A0A409VKV3_9AGAR|nr:hypothetical protein CVT24_008581 [Panaeolus cyanescens]